MSRKTWVIELVTQIVKDKPTAEMVVERLEEEGVLHLGYGDADVDRVVQKFTDTFGTTKVSRHDRFAAHRLVRRYGAQAVCGVVDLLGQSMGQKYAPVVGSITQLEDKWVNALNFLRQHRKDSEVIPNE